MEENPRPLQKISVIKLSEKQTNKQKNKHQKTRYDPLDILASTVPETETS